MPILPPSPTLADFQRYVEELETERGWINNGPLENALLMGEEVGELFKAIRKAENMGIDPNSKVGDLAEELADVFIYICAIANRYGADIEAAFRAKEEKNRTRKWA